MCFHTAHSFVQVHLGLHTLPVPCKILYVQYSLSACKWKCYIFYLKERRRDTAVSNVQFIMEFINRLLVFV